MKLRNEDDMMIMFSIFDSTVRKYESNKTLSWRDIFMISGRNGKAIINSHTQMEVPGFELRSWHPA
ncbi:hypothetical protein MTR_7g090130 [Medicago truncatula]|uniref:Uncharacterized protein n=1 Tax=Medicago truncatula TaxID=3880 RepID=G7KRM2_MEDTR|nr:hypothetical protein MTR_7g090130 [Medicago truncatula]